MTRYRWHQDETIGKTLDDNVTAIKRSLLHDDDNQTAIISGSSGIVLQEKLRTKSGKIVGTLNADFSAQLDLDQIDPTKFSLYAVDGDGHVIGRQVGSENLPGSRFATTMVNDLVSRHLIDNPHDLVPPTLLSRRPPKIED